MPVDPRLIVDLGCGTGRFTHPLADRFQAKVDRHRSVADACSRWRCAQARQWLAWSFSRRRAEQLPLEDGCCRHDFHVDGAAPSRRSRRAMAREVPRILRVGGRFACATARAILSILSRASFRACCRWSMRAAVERRGHRAFRGCGLCGSRPRAREARRGCRAGRSSPTSWPCARTPFSSVSPMPSSRRALPPCAPTPTRREPEEITEQIDFFVFERLA